MRETSALYKTLRQEPDSVYEVNIVRGQTVYGMNDIIPAGRTARTLRGRGCQRTLQHHHPGGKRELAAHGVLRCARAALLR